VKGRLNYNFTIDDWLCYSPFNSDFGPLNLSQITKFCRELDRLLTSHKYVNHCFYHTSSQNFDKQANALLLICCYAVIVLKEDPKTLDEKIKSAKIVPFRDALECDCDYACTVSHCIHAL
jgi:cell division cycle 14